jgi:site-specific DNA-methyltransferase (adenine-specific)
VVSLYYQDEAVTLYHGDCLEVTEWLDADVLVTDPPYGIGYVTGWQSMDLRVRGEVQTSNRSDRVLTPEHTRPRDSALAAWGARPAVVFGGWRAPRPEGTQMRLVWDKQRRSPGGVGVFKHSDEEIYLCYWPNPRGLAGKYGSIISEPSLRGALRPDHPTPKPVPLMALLISECPRGTIADPFAGSGSTLVAARNLGRKAIGVEIEERYCEVIAKRLAQGVLL